MRLMVSIGLFAILTGAAPPPPDGARAESRARDELEIKLRRADAALRKAPSATEEAQLQAIRGYVLFELGQTEKAKAAFIAAVQKEPAIELDASRASPEAMGLLERVRRELPGALAVVIKSGSGIVTIDDRDMGPAPLQAQLSGGRHLVRAKGPTGRTARVETFVTPGRKSILELELEPAGAPKPRRDSPARQVASRIAPPVFATMERPEFEPTTPPPTPVDRPAAAATTTVEEKAKAQAREDRPQRTWSYAIGAVGLGLAAGGGAFGIATLEAGRQAREALATSQEHALRAGEAGTFAVVADVLYGAALVAAVAALWLFLSNDASAPATRAAPLGLTVGPTRGGATLSVSGGF